MAKADPLTDALNQLSSGSGNPVQNALDEGVLTEANIESLIAARKRRIGFDRLAAVLTRTTGRTIGKRSIQTFLSSRGVD